MTHCSTVSAVTRRRSRIRQNSGASSCARHGILANSATAWAVLLLVATTSLRGAEPSLAEARRLYLTGAYDESGEIYRRLDEKEPVAAVIGQVRCFEAVGNVDEAVAVLKAAAKKHESAGEIRAELALLAMERGDEKVAERDAQAAIDLLKGDSCFRPSEMGPGRAAPPCGSAR